MTSRLQGNVGELSSPPKFQKESQLESLSHSLHSEEWAFCGADFPVRQIFQWKVQVKKDRLESLSH